MLTLYVSHDCGCSYHRERTAQTVEELQPLLDELDASWLRWYVEDDGQMRTDVMCSIYRGMFNTIEKARRNEGK